MRFKTMSKDIILLTVDTWRDDTVDLVPNLSERLQNQTEMICAGAATNFVFPSILASTYYPDAYDGNQPREELDSLPEVLSEAGYETGGFIACNPLLSKWSDRFDTFWNGQIGANSSNWYGSELEKWMSRAFRTVTLQKRVSAAEVAYQAQEWYASTDSPRFLWMHIMEPHLPYYPGIKRSREIGLLNSYRSIIAFELNKHDTKKRYIRTRRRLYEQCVDLFDSYVPQLLDFVSDDSVVVAFGDHGEEFEHGHYDHERLYDETVKVPIFFKNIEEISANKTVRQIDIAPTLLEEVRLNSPSEWFGDSENSLDSEPVLMMTPQREPSCLHAGVRSSDRKLIKSYDQDTGELERIEGYDVRNDPNEQHDISDKLVGGELEAKLDGFVTNYQDALDIDARTGTESEAVQERLEQLGYK